jgi:hypothetical protein
MVELVRVTVRLVGLAVGEFGLRSRDLLEFATVDAVMLALAAELPDASRTMRALHNEHALTITRGSSRYSTRNRTRAADPGELAATRTGEPHRTTTLGYHQHRTRRSAGLRSKLRTSVE